jgi:SAM-dependent methyltransferase
MITELPNAGKVYSEAVNSGHYDLYRGGLYGKHDNVRTYWEDQIRGMRLRKQLTRLIGRTRRVHRQIRIADLGAGSGQGLQLLTSWNRAGADLDLHQSRVLSLDQIGCYEGVDLCPEMVEQGNTIYAEWPQVRFSRGDFSSGFPLLDRQPFDLYFCSYGSYSHISRSAMETLLVETIEHAADGALVVGEWLGRNSMEWPCHWDHDELEMREYSMCYLDPANDPKRAVHFPMRFWTGSELRDLIAWSSREAGRKVKILEIYDCSLMVGRHVDTGLYNDRLRPLRRAVNRLHQSNVRTDLDTLRTEFGQVPGHAEINRFFEDLAGCWNRLVEYTQARLASRLHPVDLAEWANSPPALQRAVMTIDRVIDAAAWMRMGDPRANIIEPQLGYALRSLEHEMQVGQGMGHALVAILQVGKRR